MKKYHLTLRSGAKEVFAAREIVSFKVDAEDGTVLGLSWIDGQSSRRLYHAVPSEIVLVVESDAPTFVASDTHRVRHINTRGSADDYSGEGTHMAIPLAADPLDNLRDNQRGELGFTLPSFGEGQTAEEGAEEGADGIEDRDGG